MESKLEAAQREAEETKVIMADNLNKTEERKEKLEDLHERAVKLLNDTESLRKSTKKVKQEKRREYLKSKARLIAVVTVLALVIITVLAVMISSRSSSHPDVHRAAFTSTTPTSPNP